MELFAKRSKDLDLIKALEAELKYRTTLGSKELARDVRRAMEMLDRKAQKAVKLETEDAAWRAIFKGGRIPGEGSDRSLPSQSTQYSSDGFGDGESGYITLKNTATEMSQNSSSEHQASTQQEINRLSSTYERLRQRLLDMSLRNPMLNFKVDATSKRQLQFIDEVPEQIYLKLVTEKNAALEILHLPEPDDIPPDERTIEFKAALDHAKVSEQIYLEKIDALVAEGRDDDETAVVQLEMELRDRLRAKLGMRPRPTRRSISPSNHAKVLGFDPSPDLPMSPTAQRHQDNKLQSLKWPDILDATLSKIGEDARTAEQEMGLSTLFLVFGFLEWYEDDNSDKRLLAPLLLLPVKLDKEKNTRGKTIYYLTATAESPETNLSLEKKIERDFSRQLPQFFADEDNPGSINDYLSAVSETIEGLKRWRVRPWLMLGHFGFGRLTMYADLSTDRWPTHPTSNKLVEALLNGTDRVESGGEFVPYSAEDHELEDPEIEKLAPYLIHDADASQHSALIDVLKGKNLVIHGPPGTGKSQTITNLIANAVAQGKRVLFLAEKLAALEVVKRRLDTAGLGEFCLEVHSNHVAPARVIESLRDRHELGYAAGTQNGTGSEDQLRHSRSELKSYLTELHRKGNDGRSVFDCIWESIRAESSHGVIFEKLRNSNFPKRLLENDEELKQVRYALSLYAAVRRAFEDDLGSIKKSPLSLLKFGPAAHQGSYLNLKEQLENLVRSARVLATVANEAAEHGIDGEEDAEAVMAVCEELPQEPPDPEMIRRISALTADQIQLVSKGAIELQDLRPKATIGASLRDLSDGEIKEICVLHREVAETEFEELPFYKLSTEAKRVLEWSERSERLVRVVQPVVHAFEYDDVNFGELSAIVCVVKFLGGLSPEEVAWFAWVDGHNETTISDAFVEWAELVHERQKWTRRFPRCRRFPRAEDLTEVASILRKGGIARAIGAFAGQRKRVETLMSDLGIVDNSALKPDELDSLVVFLSRLKAFESNREYGELFGNLWEGLRTPLDLIRSATNARLELRKRLIDMKADPSLFEKVDRLSEQELLSLGKLSISGAEVVQEDRARFTSHKILTTVNDSKRGVSSARRILAARLPSLEHEHAKLKLLAEEAQFELVRRRVVASLQALPELEDCAQWLSDKEQIEKLKLATDWLVSTGRHLRKPILREKFASIGSEEGLQRVFNSAANYSQAYEEVGARLSTIRDECDVRGFDQFNPKAMYEFAVQVLSRPDELKRYLGVSGQRHDVAKFGLEGFLGSLDQLEISSENYSAIFDAVVAWRRADRDRRASSALSKASGAGLEARRNDFIGHDKRKIWSDRKSIANRLITRLPQNGSSVGPKKHWTEMALLQNEFGKEKRFVPIRNLIVRAGRAIQTLKPCFLMSPLSLAKYIPAKTLEFDLLIVDEASQMRPEDVLGALLRVKQLVVVGDTKQLPPTDFFQRNDQSADEDDVDGGVDDESVLEACQKTFRQVRMLRWHYRSRCESLIAFSNREFYKNGLITFPSAVPGSFSIDLVRVNGTYKAGRNLDEAQRIAEEAIALMRHYADFQRDVVPTIGLVAVNTKQRDLIYETLRQLEAGDEKVERYREKVSSKGEPVFIKNLENVQGDERDFILISLTYGPESGQKVVAQRFGPISSKQGHRRLNVLFSRARLRIGLFTSLGSEDVSPSETSSEGIRVLKRYLEYAEHRGKAEYENIGASHESDFEREIAERLRQRGYLIETQVGVSGYRIDLGVRDPINPSRFLTGIECDGARYHSSKSARERDRLREEILKGLGWNILRVWSTDWFDDPSGETDKLCRKIDNLRRDTPESENEYRFFNMKSGELASEGTAQIVEMSSDTESSQGVASASNLIPEATTLTSPTDKGQESGRDIASLLRQFRDQVISREVTDWEPQRSILRDGMIETLIAQRVADPADWFNKIPTFQRMGTNPLEKEKYLGQICELIDEHILN